MTKQDKTGEFLCSYCQTHVEGEVIIGYKYEDDFVEDVSFLHKDCEKPYKLARAGKNHKCPKCDGAGTKLKDTMNLYRETGQNAILVYSSQVYNKPGRFANGTLEKIRDVLETCNLCDGDGFLEKEPIPVITDWKKAP